MKRISPLVAAGISAVVILAVPTLAPAALPTKGVLLKGTLHDAALTALAKPVDLKVAPTGQTARFSWWCGRPQTVSNRNLITVPIKSDGTFAGTSNVGKVTVWSVEGRFVTATSSCGSRTARPIRGSPISTPSATTAALATTPARAPRP